MEFFIKPEVNHNQHVLSKFAEEKKKELLEGSSISGYNMAHGIDYDDYYAMYYYQET